jgi:hypothetical protein
MRKLLTFLTAAIFSIAAGADDTLTKVSAVQAEMSLSPTYSGERLMPEQVNFLLRKGFRLIDIANSFRDPQARLLHVDGFFEPLDG